MDSNPPLSLQGKNIELTSIKVIKGLLKKYSLKPEKRLGQHFLWDKKVLRKIVKAADLKPKDVVLEIGPGIGNLTQELAKRVKKVIAVEKDQKMIEILKETVGNLKNVEIFQADILKYQISKIKNQKYKVVANLPYYIVSPVIRKFLECKVAPYKMILMVQKEVAQRISAKPPNLNLLAVSVQFYAQPKIISYVSKKSFWPQPKVDSAILRISQIHADLKTDPHRFFQIVKSGFSQPRKQLLNNLSRGLKIDKEKIKIWLLKNKIQPYQRPGTLSLENWLSLTKSFAKI